MSPIEYNTLTHPTPDPAKVSGQYSAAVRYGYPADDLRRELTVAKIGRVIALELAKANVNLTDDDVDRLVIVLRAGGESK